jgi:hypothetical protein
VIAFFPPPPSSNLSLLHYHPIDQIFLSSLPLLLILKMLSKAILRRFFSFIEKNSPNIFRGGREMGGKKEKEFAR